MANPPIHTDNFYDIITESLQHEIDSVSQAGGGRVALSPGTYCTGLIKLKSNVCLHLEEGATLLGSINPYDYEGYANGEANIEETNHFALIVANGARNISITGKGTIDGRGLDLALAIDSLHHTGERIDPDYNTKRMRPNLRPKLIEFDSVDSILVEGVNLRSSASWGLSMNKCSNIEIRNIDFVNRAYWNNDGIDMIDCHNAIVEGCAINAADDGI